jgi:hypothetical protein
VKVLTPQINDEVFRTFFCNPERLPCEAITVQGFKCFVAIFRDINT